MSSLVAPWPNVAEIPTFPAVSPIDWVTFITGGAVACSWAGIKAILGWIKVYFGLDLTLNFPSIICQVFLSGGID